MGAYFHNILDNRLSVVQKQLGLLFFGVLFLSAYLSFHLLVELPSAKISKKKTLSLQGKIISSKVFSAEAYRTRVKLPSGDVLIVHIPNVPWEQSKCVKGSVIRGLAKAYPYRKSSGELIGQAWLKDYECSWGDDAAIPSLITTLPEAGDSLGILLSSTIGNKELLSYQCQEVFRILGISHLLVISGFHVGIVFSCLYFCLYGILKTSTFLLYRVPVSKVATSISLLFCFFYISQIESGVPAVRAFLMLFIAGIAHIFDRKAFSLRNVFFAAFAILIVSPRLVLSPGFLLSFFAVFGLIIVGNNVSAPRTLRAKISFALLMSFSAWSFSAPIAIFFFKSLSLLAPLINIVMMPLFSFLVIILGGFLFIGASYLPSLFMSTFQLYLENLDVALEFLWELSEFLRFQHLSIQKQWVWHCVVGFVLINILLVFILKFRSNSRLDMLAR